MVAWARARPSLTRCAGGSASWRPRGTCCRFSTQVGTTSHPRVTPASLGFADALPWPILCLFCARAHMGVPLSNQRAFKSQALQSRRAAASPAASTPLLSCEVLLIDSYFMLLWIRTHPQEHACTNHSACPA